MGIFRRKKKTQDTVTGFKLVHDIELPLIPFGDNITKSDVVMICIDRVASQCAKLKGRYVKVDEKGVQTEKKGELSFILKRKPNEVMTPSQFLYKVVSLLLLNNNAFVYPRYDQDSNTLTGIYPLNPLTVEPIEYSDGSHTYKFYFQDGTQYEIPVENVIHLRRFYSANTFFGGNNSTQEHDALLKTLTINDALLQGVDAAVRSSFKIKGILKINGMLKEADRNRQLDEFNRAVEKATKNDSSIIPMDAKAEYTPLTSDPKLVDEPTLKFVQSKILDYFGVSEAVFTNSYDENEFNAFYESTIEPIAIQLCFRPFAISSAAWGGYSLFVQVLRYAEQVEQMIKTNASNAQDQDEYSKCFDALCGKYDQLKEIYDKVFAERQVKLAKATQLDAFMSYIQKGETVITEWSSDIWNVLVESGTVHRDGSITFKFKNGKQVTVQ